MPDSTSAQYELGLALFENGRLRESVPYFEFVAKKRPKFADAQYSLASVYARVNASQRRLNCCQQVIQLSPEHFRGNLLLGRIFTLQHRSMSLALPEAGGTFRSQQF